MQSMWHIWGRREFYVEFSGENLQGKDRVEEPVQNQQYDPNFIHSLCFD
jgi:hypothetical protein